MKKLLLLTLVLFMGACSIEPASEPAVDEPTIGPQLNKQGENSVELWLKGEWIVFGSENTKNKMVYKYSKDLGKRYLTYDNLGNFSSCASYEIRKDYFTDAAGKQTHLFVMYASEEITLWNEQSVYMEIEEIGADQYKMHMRGYNLDTVKPEDLMKNPKATYRMNVAVHHEKLK